MAHLQLSKAFMAAFAFLLGGSVLHGVMAAPPESNSQPPLVIKSQGNRTFGGTTIGAPTTGSLHCDHGYVDWQTPQNPREFPLLMVHASSKRTWLTTWDGKEGFRDIFVRRGFSVWLTDLPRTGQAGQACEAYSYTPALTDQNFFNTWRLGLWLPGQSTPTYYPGVQFPTNTASLNQFLRIQTPEFNTPANEALETDALAILLSEIGPSIVLTHSSTGIRGWLTGTKSDKVKAIVSYEPGAFVFPPGELPPPEPLADGTTRQVGREIPLSDFLKLTKMPIQMIWGDFIPDKLDPANVGPRHVLDTRRVNRLTSERMAKSINDHGGDAEVLRLPDIGITGNTHFMMLDTNNTRIAELLSEFLHKKALDGRKP